MNSTGVQHTAAHDRRVRRTSLLVGGLLVVAVTAFSACGASASSGGSSAARPAQAGSGGVSSNGASSAGTSGSAAGATASKAASSTHGRPVATPGSGKLGTAVKASAADVVRSGSVTLVAPNATALRRSYTGLSALAGTDGGFVASSTLTTGKHPTARLSLRVMEGRFYPVMQQIAGGTYGKADNSKETGQDVTGQVVDLRVEIANLTSEENAVRQLLDKAGTVRNILTVQQQLFSLQGEIQELQAQSNSLGNQIEYASISVNLTTVAPPPLKVTPKPRPSTLARFWHLASNHSVATVRGFVLAVGWAAPLLIALAVIGAAGLIWRRRRRHHGVGNPGTVA